MLSELHWLYQMNARARTVVGSRRRTDFAFWWQQARLLGLKLHRNLLFDARNLSGLNLLGWSLASTKLSLFPCMCPYKLQNLAV